MSRFIKEHKWAIFAAAAVGVISVAPQIVFIVNPANNYQGIPVFLSPNEESYLAIMQEIADGYVSAASVPFFEYKDSYSLLPPTIPILYVAFSKLFNVSLVSTLIISKFFLPAILFLLIYFFVYILCTGGAWWQRKLNAIAAGSLVVFGFELQNYRMLWRFLTGDWPIGSFLVWTRLVNPISGAILLFIFLICIWFFLEKRKRYVIFPAGIVLALMMASYVFSWTLVLTIMAVLGVFAIFRRDWGLIKFLIPIFFAAIALSAPYWVMAWKASQMPWYAEAASRIGLWHTRAPHLNKFLVFVSIIFVLFSYFKLYRKRQAPQLWWWFSLSWLLAGFIVYNQQIITGTEIWYYHYVFYTIPLGYITLLLLLWYFVRPDFSRVWLLMMTVAIAASFALIIYGQISVYYKDRAFYRDLQKYTDVFNFLNTKALKDCVVLALQENFELSTYVTALTHCNTYFSGERFVIAPPERFLHNYLSLLRLSGVGADEIDDYLAENKTEASGYLFYDIHFSLGYPDRLLEEELKSLPDNYKKFMQKDFYQQLKKYRIDYILSVGDLDKGVMASLPPMKKVFDQDSIILYAVP